MTDTPPPADDLVERLRILQEILQRDPLVVTEIENHTVWPACVHVLDVVSAVASEIARLRQKLEDAERAKIELAEHLDRTVSLAAREVADCAQAKSALTLAQSQRDALAVAAEPFARMFTLEREASALTNAQERSIDGYVWFRLRGHDGEALATITSGDLRALASARAQAMGE